MLANSLEHRFLRVFLMKRVPARAGTSPEPTNGPPAREPANSKSSAPLARFANDR